jgi:hypothetical protein
MTDFKRPLVVTSPTSETIVAEMGAEKHIVDDDVIVDIYISPTLVYLESEQGERPDLPVDPYMFSDEQYERFNQITYSIGKIIRLAELNLDSLIGLIETYFSANDYESVRNKNKRCRKCPEFDRESKFKALSFEQLRGILSCIVKTDSQFHGIEGLTDSSVISHFTSTYHDYIYDRDCYTHGKLFFKFPEYEPVLRVIPRGKKNILYNCLKKFFMII